jgi:hypothetical protein
MPLAEITRAETAERARLLRVESYQIMLDLSGGAEVFGSTRDPSLARLLAERRDIVARALRSRDQQRPA